jgi:hypothetical protein
LDSLSVLVRPAKHNREVAVGLEGVGVDAPVKGAIRLTEGGLDLYELRTPDPVPGIGSVDVPGVEERQIG